MRASYGRSCSASTHLCTQRRGRATLGCWLPASNIRASVPSCSRPRCYAFWGCNLGLKLGEPINANGNEIWTERRGQGLTSCSSRGSATPPRRGSQLDGLSERYLLTAFDNRGAGRTPLPEGRLSASTMADDAAALLRALEVPSAHVAGFSMGSAIAQELALRHPGSSAASSS